MPASYMEPTISLVFGFVLTWVVGLSPPILLRYDFFKGPISKAAAGAACLVYFVVMFAVVAAVGGRPNATFLVALVSYFILTRPNKETAGDGAVQAATRKQIGRPPIDGFESHVGQSCESNAKPTSDSRPDTTHDDINVSKATSGQSERDKGFREKMSGLSSFERTVFLILLGFVLLMLFYYIASPYQNCIRQKYVTESSCLRNTGW
jgi:hypothetical protein